MTVTARVTDTLHVSATLVSATPPASVSGQQLVWSGVVVPSGGVVTLTVVVRAGSGSPVTEEYLLPNSVVIGPHDGGITRAAPGVTVQSWRVFVPIVRRAS